MTDDFGLRIRYLFSSLVLVRHDAPEQSHRVVWGQRAAERIVGPWVLVGRGVREGQLPGPGHACHRLSAAVDECVIPIIDVEGTGRRRVGTLAPVDPDGLGGFGGSRAWQS